MALQGHDQVQFWLGEELAYSGARYAAVACSTAPMVESGIRMSATLTSTRLMRQALRADSALGVHLHFATGEKRDKAVTTSIISKLDSPTR